jgi:hypothetical protein
MATNTDPFRYIYWRGGASIMNVHLAAVKWLPVQVVGNDALGFFCSAGFLNIA